ncbi:hypothetical protein DNTS_022964 [Danionella cerebrum]|uniref:Coiled-coil domain-containing protein 71 n=1 Tax=Danionella cerebrum TaxID=2873325 RepID=A0A553RHG8_9TELE|nr:hypothetical protein DNTS_022964 [Danionella translucida]
MGRVVHTWARLAPAGQAALEEALRVFNPMSQDLSETERQMAFFLQEMKKEGASPTVLRSKDVYGYTSCTTETISTRIITKVPKVQKPCKKRGGRKGLGKTKDGNCTMLGRATKVILQNQPKILLTNLMVDSLKQKSPSELSDKQSFQSQQCLKLTNIKGLTGGHTARLQIHIGADSQDTPSFPLGRPLGRSGIPRSPTENSSQISNVVALDNRRHLSCPFKVEDALIGDSAPLVCQNGYGLQKIQAASGKPDSMTNGPVRRLRFQSFNWSQSLLTNGQMNGSSLECKVIKVDESVTDEELRRKAQKILRVNLSPVIQIHPLVDSI